MLRPYILLAMLLMCYTPILPGAAQVSKDRPVKDKWALVVGISQFSDGSINLQYPAKDACDFAQFLVKEGHFAADHVRVLTNADATRENILSEIGDTWLPRVVQPDDLALIYISSHGSPSGMDVKGINYVLAYNTEKDRLYATGISIQDLSSMIRDRVHSDRVVVILDACHSGAAKTGDKGIARVSNFNAESIAQGTGQMVICSSAPNQVSWESKQYPNGVFTHHLISSLRKKTRLADAFDWLHDQVQTEVLQDRGELQTPVMKSQWKGNALSIIASPSGPRAGIAPIIPLRRTAGATVKVAMVPNVVAQASSGAAAGKSNTAIAQVPVSVGGQSSVAPPAAEYGEYASNGMMRMKVLDTEQKMTGFQVVLEFQNTSSEAFNPWNTAFEMYDQGFYQQRLGGSSVYGADTNVAPGAKVKLEFKASNKADEILVKFPKPNWKPVRLKLTTEGTDSVQLATPAKAEPGSLTTSGDYSRYASNGYVRMKMLDAEEKATGFYMTVELVNDTTQGLEPWNFKFNCFQDGYTKGGVTGSGIYGGDITLPPGRRAKLQFSTTEKVNEIQVSFPKPGWAPLKLLLR